MKLLSSKLFLLVALVFADAARAQDLDLIGNVRWLRSGPRVRIEVAQIHNYRESGTSGSLRLQIWATVDPYDPSTNITGYVIGTANLRPLAAGADFFNVVKRAGYRRPPAGYYFTTVTLEERYSGGSWLIIDSENFAGVVNLGGYGEGYVEDLELSNSSDLTFEGDLSWLSGDRRVEIFAESIRNLAARRTGALRLRMFASDEKYVPPYTRENPFYSFPLATKRFSRILPFSNVQFYARVPFRPPPEGEWFVTITLEEYNRGWFVRDHYTYNDLRLF